jgi:hypothetical protein
MCVIAGFKSDISSSIQARIAYADGAFPVDLEEGFKGRTF